jgi:hypothetical protein
MSGVGMFCFLVFLFMAGYFFGRAFSKAEVDECDCANKKDLVQ